MWDEYDEHRTGLSSSSKLHIFVQARGTSLPELTGPLPTAQGQALCVAPTHHRQLALGLNLLALAPSAVARADGREPGRL